MCILSKPDIPPAPELPPERAAMRAPDQSGVRADVTSRVTDRMRAGAGTILTSGSGVTTMADTDKKTLLGA